MRIWTRPDQRCFLHSRDSDRDAFGALVDAALRTTTQDVYIEVDGADTGIREALRARGFTVNRVEDRYVLPTDPARTGLSSRGLPAGYAIVPAADADVDRWRELDDALRQDVPGCAGWRNDPEGFGAQNLKDEQFDPATYLLAVEESSGAHVGLVRVWSTSIGPRLGLIGALAAHRRRGLARALLAEAFGVLDRRGQGSVTCEVDQSNVASQRLTTGLGARREGVSFELVRRHARA
jgi:ribosomal protein S18 acetylase RimI-like enzyme